MGPIATKMDFLQQRIIKLEAEVERLRGYEDKWADLDLPGLNALADIGLPEYREIESQRDALAARLESGVERCRKIERDSTTNRDDFKRGADWAAGQLRAILGGEGE